MKTGKKFWAVGLIGLLMVCGLVFAGCGTKCDRSCVADGTDNYYGNYRSDSKSCSDDCASTCKAMINWSKRGSGTTYRCDCI